MNKLFKIILTTLLIFLSILIFINISIYVSILGFKLSRYLRITNNQSEYIKDINTLISYHYDQNNYIFYSDLIKIPKIGLLILIILSIILNIFNNVNLLFMLFINGNIIIILLFSVLIISCCIYLITDYFSEQN